MWLFLYLSFVTSISDLIFLCSSRAAECDEILHSSISVVSFLIIALVTKYLTRTFCFLNGLHYLRIGFPLGIAFSTDFHLDFNAFVTTNKLGWTGKAENDWYEQDGVWTLEVFFVLLLLFSFLLGKYQKCLLELMKEKWSCTAYHINTVLGFPRENFSFVSRWFFLLYLSCLNDK